MRGVNDKEPLANENFQFTAAKETELMNIQADQAEEEKSELQVESSTAQDETREEQPLETKRTE